MTVAVQSADIKQSAYVRNNPRQSARIDVNNPRQRVARGLERGAVRFIY